MENIAGIEPACIDAFACLAFVFAPVFQQVGAYRDAGVCRYAGGDPFALVESAPSQFPFVQRYGHDVVDRVEEAVAGEIFCEQLS